MGRILVAFAALALLLAGNAANSEVISSRYVTLHFSSPGQLRKFNDNLRLSRKLHYYFRQRKNIVTLEDEVLGKIDTVIEKAEIILDMFPDGLQISIVLLDSARDVARTFKAKYGKNVDHIAYYSLSEDTIYISVEHTRLKVLAHEVGHAIVDHYFEVRPPYNIHELMAQFTEKHIDD